jgi:hypothetical protein
LNDQLQGWADIRFHPKRIALDFDPAVATLIQNLRDHGDISRESTLDELGFDQDDEARKRQKEKEQYDDIFTPVNVPFDSPGKAGQNDGGGNANGGGSNPDSFTPNSGPVNPRKGNNA